MQVEDCNKTLVYSKCGKMTVEVSACVRESMSDATRAEGSLHFYDHFRNVSIFQIAATKKTNTYVS